MTGWTILGILFLAGIGPIIFAHWSFIWFCVFSFGIVIVTKQVESAYLIAFLYFAFGFFFWDFGATLPGIWEFFGIFPGITWFFSTGIIAILSGLLTRNFWIVLAVIIIWTLVCMFPGGVDLSGIDMGGGSSGGGYNIPDPGIGSMDDL